VKTKSATRDRIIALDMMRGYFMISILLNHLNYFPNGLYFVSMGGNLYVQAAEGFFFISGLVLGIVRGDKLRDKPFRQVAGLLLRRGLKLYLTSAIAIMLFVLIGWTLDGHDGLKSGLVARPDSVGDFLNIIWRVLSFQYVYGWADFLRLYAVYLFAAPLFMWLLRRGRWYVGLVISLAIWGLAQYVLNTNDLSWHAKFMWQIATWQWIFYSGLTVGFYFKTITNWWRRLARNWRRIFFSTITTAAVVTLLGNIILIVFGGGAPFVIETPLHDTLKHLQGTWYDAYFIKESMPIFWRYSLFLLWFTAGFMVVHRFRHVLARWLGWLLLAFGQNSLYSYIMSAIVLFAVHLVMPDSAGLFVNSLVSVGAVALVWLAIKTKFLMKIIPR
jgi:hypothetical protein